MNEIRTELDPDNFGPPEIKSIDEKSHILHFNRIYHKILDDTASNIVSKSYIKFSPRQRNKTQQLIQDQQQKFKKEKNKRYQREKEKNDLMITPFYSSFTQ